jgi:predicted enzyme related to lactoylglutathione lyase
MRFSLFEGNKYFLYQEKMKGLVLSKMTNIVNHVEIPVIDLKKATKFYKAIFEWEIDLDSMPNYGLVEIKGAASIGLFVVEKIPDHGINVVFEVEDIEEKLEQIIEAGGKVKREKYQIAPEIGYSAQFLDCFGNEFGLFSQK